MTASSFNAAGLKPLASLIVRLEREAAERAVWIDTVTAKLRTALAHAAASEPFDWDKLGPDPWPLIPDDFAKQTHALGHHPGVSEDEACAIGAALIATHYTPETIRQALEWEDDVALYGAPDVHRLQVMSHETPYPRRQWIDAWTRSYSYRTAKHRGELPALADWLDLMRKLLPGRTLQGAASIADFIQGFSALGDILCRVAADIIELALLLGMPPCRVGRGPCFCHPKPFPAARDYHRRTRGRRRRS